MLLAILLFFLGLVVLTVASEILVRGAARLAFTFGVSSLIIGLTVVSFATSSPEIVVSALSAYRGEADLAVGNIIGSNIFNLLFIVGFCALLQPIAIHKQLLRVDLPFMFISACVLYGFCWQGVVTPLNGLFLWGMLVGYCIWIVYHSKKQQDALTHEFEQRAEAVEIGKKNHKIAKNVFYVFIGLVGLVFGANWTVEGAVKIARFLGVSELVIGLTIVSVGTSLPELATSLIAHMRGERDIAVGNAIGSTTFNLLAVMGTAAWMSSSGVPISETVLLVDYPIQLGVMLVCFPIFLSDLKVVRWEGMMFLLYYAMYIAYLILEASGSLYLETLKAAFVFGVIPLTLLIVIGATAYPYCCSAARK